MSRVDHLHVIDAGMHVCITVLELGVWPPQCHIFLLPPPPYNVCMLFLFEWGGLGGSGDPESNQTALRRIMIVAGPKLPERLEPLALIVASPQASQTSSRKAAAKSKAEWLEAAVPSQSRYFGL